MTDLIIRETLRPMIPECVNGALAGQFQLAVLADAERTRGIGVLFVPLDELAAVEAFVRRQCGGREPTTTKTIGPIRPETN